MVNKVTAVGSDESMSSKRSSAAMSEGVSAPLQDASRRASDVADTAKQVASEAGERLNITMEDQKRAGAQRISQVAQAVLTAAGQLDRDSPEFARYIRGAAEQVQDFSEKLRSQNVSELFQEFQSFAKKHPTAFLGATVLTGFALARFLKSATDGNGSGTRSTQTKPQTTASKQPAQSSSHSKAGQRA